MSGTNKDDEAWRAIVENYGEHPQVEDLPSAVVEPEPSTYDDEVDEVADEGDRFVPPEPPPAPHVDLPRHLPWVAVFGVPALLLVMLFAGVDLPAWLGYFLVCSFVGSFVYLVLTMQRGGRDPWDDGARL